MSLASRLRLPEPIDGLVDRAEGAAAAASSAVLPLAGKVAGAAVGTAHRLVSDVAGRLGLHEDAEQVEAAHAAAEAAAAGAAAAERPKRKVRAVRPAGGTTPAQAHAAAEADLAAAVAAGDVPADGGPRADLPVDDWDGLTVAAVRHRVRALDGADVRVLLAYEKEHAARPGALLALERRLARIAEESGPGQPEESPAPPPSAEAAGTGDAAADSAGATPGVTPGGAPADAPEEIPGSADDARADEDTPGTAAAVPADPDEDIPGAVPADEDTPGTAAAVPADPDDASGTTPNTASSEPTSEPATDSGADPLRDAQGSPGERPNDDPAAPGA